MTNPDNLTLSGYNKNAKKIDDALKLLNKAIRKNADKIELITQLADKIDIISDYIETIIDDKLENKEYVNMIGKMAGEIVDLINQYIGDSDASAPVEPEVEEPVETTPEDDTTPAETEESEVAEVEIPEDDEGIEEEPEEGDED
jgi:type II secretory pathway component GspD/PulD (secretin)